MLRMSQEMRDMKKSMPNGIRDPDYERMEKRFQDVTVAIPTLAKNSNSREEEILPWLT
jgi:hypothetical protein